MEGKLSMLGRLACAGLLVPTTLVAQGTPCVSRRSGSVPAAYAATVARERMLVCERLATRIPGVQVAVAVNGKLVWSEGFGYADAARMRPVARQTRQHQKLDDGHSGEARRVAQQVLGQTREQKQEKHRRLVPGAPERAVDLGERVPPDETRQRGPTHHPGEPEVEGRAERDADGGVEEPSPGPEDVAGGERGDLAGDGGDHDLQKLDGNAPQRAGRAALAQQGDQVVLVRDAMQYARVPQHGHADHQQHDQANGEEPFACHDNRYEKIARVSAPSCSSSQRLRSRPPPNPVSAPLAPTTRWHGTMMGMGFLPLAAPTARVARKSPSRRARSL